VAANGLEVLDALERQRYDVVLMDVQMPEMDGLEATRRLRQRFQDDERPRVIAMTANAMQGDRELCLDAGMDDYVSKPVRVQELAAALARSGRNGRADDVLDLTALETLIASWGEDDRELLADLTRTFLEHAPALLLSLREAVAAQDAVQARRAAHTLKSNGESFGAKVFAARCAHAEALAGAGDTAALAALVEPLEEEFRRVKGALEAMFQPGVAP
jgi:CheY-like chemotaxis protein